VKLFSKDLFDKKKLLTTTHEAVGEVVPNMYLVWNYWSSKISLAIQLAFINLIYIGISITPKK